jgi:hypothetical protein
LTQQNKYGGERTTYAASPRTNFAASLAEKIGRFQSSFFSFMKFVFHQKFSISVKLISSEVIWLPDNFLLRILILTYFIYTAVKSEMTNTGNRCLTGLVRKDQ